MYIWYKSWDSVLDALLYFKTLGKVLPHFGVFDNSKMVVIEDKGGTIRFRDGVELKIIPAHFLHSTGNFNLYDPVSKILFSVI